MSEIRENIPDNQKLTRREFVLLMSALGLFGAGGTILRQADQIRSVNAENFLPPFPKESEDLFTAWNRLNDKYQYRSDEDGDYWQIEDYQGDCEDFVLKLFYEYLDQNKYNALLAWVDYEDKLSAFKGRKTTYKNNAAHMVMFLSNRQKQLFMVDNGAWGGIGGPHDFGRGFQSVETFSAHLAEEQNRTIEYFSNFFVQREITGIKVKSLPKIIPQDDPEALRIEGGWFKTYPPN